MWIPIVAGQLTILTLFVAACAGTGDLRSTATLVAAPTARSSPSPTPTPSPTSEPSATPRPVSTATPTPTPVPTNTPTATAKPDSAPTETPEPDPTPTPVPLSDKFGVISVDPSGYRMDTLGLDWYIQFNADTTTIPPGTIKVPFVSVNPSRTRLTTDEIEQFTSAAPGSTWYIGGEPNVPQQDGISPTAYVDELDYYAAQIRDADPTAKIMGPSILNWDFTCTGCGGFQSGEAWMREFIDAYADAHEGTTPPVDAWAIDTYPLTWNDLPMSNWEIVRDQIVGFRNFLETEVPGHADTPIWITEIASHWAFSEWEIREGTFGVPDGLPFQWQVMSDYMDNILNWLESNSEEQKIDRWFFFIDWIDIETSAADGYAGIHFFESGEDGAPLNQLGQNYREHALGLR